jgi:hypothetical protein
MPTSKINLTCSKHWLSFNFMKIEPFDHVIVRYRDGRVTRTVRAVLDWSCTEYGKILVKVWKARSNRYGDNKLVFRLARANIKRDRSRN